jgi:hypothetical protein
MIPSDYILIYTYIKQEAKGVLMGDKARFSKCEGETAKNRKLAKNTHIMVLFSAQKLNLE